jgi:hypothetical protein
MTPGRAWLVYGAVALVGAGVVASIGGADPVGGVAAVVDGFLRGAVVAGVIACAAMGYGGVVVSKLRRVRARAALEMAVGLGIVLVGWLVLGAVGIVHLFTAWATLLPGVGLFVSGLMRRRPAVSAPPAWAWASLPGFVVLFVAASSPPGALWASEFGGYDALSYHLPLASAWIADARVWPVEHSAYSYLPSLVESGFAWIGALTGASGESVNPLLGGGGDGGGWRLVLMQQVHAWCVVSCAWMVAVGARTLARAVRAPHAVVRTAGPLAAGLCACTPWVVVVGSLAYNDAASALFAAAALVVALEPRMAAAWRGVLVGALVGVACLAKPTAIVLAAPAAGLVAAWVVGRRGGVKGVAVVLMLAAAVGVVILLPWLVRTGIASGGNPVFPLLTETLGRGHWTEAQSLRWSAAHAPEGDLGERLRLALWTSPFAGAGAAEVERWRGVTNAQWGVLWLVALVGLVVLVVRRRSRWIGVVLGVGVLVSLVGWLAVTHIQSRFLVPLAPVGAVVAGVGVTLIFALRRSGVRAVREVGVRGVGARGMGAVRVCGVVAGCVVAVQAGWLVVRFAGERGGRPNELLAAGPSVLMGRPYSPELGAVSPAAFVNNELPEDAVVLLVGEATPAYYDRRVVWASAWDQARLLPGEPGAGWTERVREMGVTHVLVSLPEIERLRGSGYIDAGVTGEGVLRWVEGEGRVVMGWREVGVVLVRVG